MIVRIENIGAIEKASFNVDKDMMIFIGPNNTGKTYAAYSLYGLRRYGFTLSDDFVNSIVELDLSELFRNGTIDIDLFKIFNKENIGVVSEEYKKQFREFLPQLFGVDSGNFKNADVSFSLEDGSSLSQHISSSNFFVSLLSFGGIKIEFRKNDNILHVTFEKKERNGEKDTEEEIDRVVGYIKRYIIQYSLHPFNNHYESVFIPAERIGISVFSKDLFSSRFAKTNEILSKDTPNRAEIIDLMNREVNIYSIVMQDALRNYERSVRLSERSISNRSIRALADELESEILNGKIVATKDGDVFFETGQTASIKLQASGSIIKSLTSLVLYLRYEAHSGQILIIDEPEINLHPDNQRLVARILAKISKLGVKVIVSTHSDYFIKELNNLIMLGKEHPQTSALKEKHGYSDSEILNYNRVGAYLFKKDRKVEELKVTDEGMQAMSIDEEINKLNNTSNDIYWTLFEN